MSFRQVYVRKEVWPKVILKRLSVSLTHPYKCTRCKERFHKIHEATAHYLSSHQNSNDLPEKEIPENETKIKIEKFGDQIKNEIRIEIKEDIKFETEVQRGLEIIKKIEFPISKETNENQTAKSVFEKNRENEDLQLENNADFSDISSDEFEEDTKSDSAYSAVFSEISSDEFQEIEVEEEAPVHENEFESENCFEKLTTDTEIETYTILKNISDTFVRAGISTSRVYCDLCQIIIRLGYLEQHLNGKRHKKNMPKFRCEICNFEIENQNELFKHLAGKDHKNKPPKEILKMRQKLFSKNEVPKGPTFIMEGFNNGTTYKHIKKALMQQFSVDISFMKNFAFDDRYGWQYRLWSFKSGDTKLKIFLPKNQHTYPKEIIVF